MQDKAQKKLRVSNIVSLTMSLIALLLFAGVVHVLHGKFERTLSELESPITGITRFYMTLPHAMWYVPALVLLFAGLLVKEKLIASPLIKLVINKIFLVMTVLFLVGYIVAMMMPLYTVPVGL
jgi:hypothetical protein